MVFKTPSNGRRRGAFTLIQVAVAAGLAGIMFVSLYGGLSSAFNFVRVNRENLRATQILLEKTEMIRLYNWDQINNGWCNNAYNPTNASVPHTFTAPYYPESANGGFLYNGTVTITNAPIADTYSCDMRAVTIALSWSSGDVLRTRSMTTFVSRYGLQNYVY